MTKKNIPRLIISGLNGGSGKTTVSLGLARILSNKGYAVKTFKKGPDYIDAAWLARAARSPQGNLDLYFTPQEKVLSLFHVGMNNYEGCIIEGNRGLFDGVDAQGSYSTSALARVLKTPMILVLDCTKMTRTAAAILHGCMTFEQDIMLAGVILNRVGTKRQELLIRESLQGIAPVLGALPRRNTPFIQERYMGLTSVFDNDDIENEITAIAEFVGNHSNIETIWKLACTASELHISSPLPTLEKATPSPLSPKTNRKKILSGKEKENIHGKKPTIGYVYDAAFWFYYHENLQALVEAGANITPVSLLEKTVWENLDGLYIGGGIPEQFAKELSTQKTHRDNVRSMANDGVPIYAECGGLVYLSSSLHVQGKDYPMSDVFPLHFAMKNKPIAHGYTEVSVIKSNPFHPVGTSFRGHEFHFSCCNSMLHEPFVLEVHKGEGLGKKETKTAYDGVLFQQTFASYMHIYAPAVEHWASAFVNTCLAQKR